MANANEEQEGERTEMQNIKSEEEKGSYGCIHTECDVELETSAMERFSEFAEITYMHGPSAIKRSKFILRKIFWIVVFIFGWVMTVLQLHTLIVNYFSGQTSTTSTFESSTSLKFPAVTICNLNALRRSALPLSGADIENLTNTLQGAPNSLTNWTSLDHDSTSRFYNAYSNEVKRSLQFLYYYVHLDTAKRKSIGHDLETMLLDCSFNGYQCSPVNFSHFNNPVYGNCYTFNSAKHVTSVRTEQSGPVFGLSLVLFIEEDEYTGEVFSNSGMRVLAHDQNNMPFPEDEGISLSTGFLTSVGISRVEETRAKPYYGKCRTYTEDENKLYNVYSNEQGLDVGYSLSACMKTCFQKNLIKHCNCCWTLYPCDNNFYDNVRNRQDLPYCLGSDTNQDLCVRNFNALFEEEKSECNTLCKTPCWDVRFKTTTSMSRYPVSSAVNSIVNNLKSRSPNLNASLSSMTTHEQREFLERNILKVNIYYETMTYESIKTEPAYESENLISDIGGQFGLWLGLSMVSIFEFLEMVIYLFAVIMLNCRNKDKDENTEPKPSECDTNDKTNETGIHTIQNESGEIQEPVNAGQKIPERDLNTVEIELKKSPD